MKSTTTVVAKAEAVKLDLSVKTAGQNGRVFVTPAMFFNKV
jgi:hypothetical protein